ncbi:MAG: energy-converting hydrogenase subunit [Methanothermococcus sp.]|jgi:energy-converting hydrogenase A subunit A|uniref:energy-converting NiFe hydrogenase A subunit EhaA n=1 Tax=Methanothermococcus TaxID=155862 RepID=UPI0003607D5D|nr:MULTISPECIES: energy-converting NiFe hydrogenase A subunit EhaA [Methanothermococcus]MDK2789739.1 energy-converting hydrogenase subunit [Methanothermococcus sp.]MDK2986954.1 energy-converting hydrogenase subunit [Methanothermococcus sp.]
MDTIIYYSISVVSSLIFALLFRMPLLPNMDSFETYVLFPTPFVALGLTGILKLLFGLDVVICVVVGIVSALFSKYANRIFPGVSYGAD